MSRFVRKKIYGRGLGGIFRGIYKFFRPLLNFILPTISKVVSSKTGKKLIKQAKKSAIKAGIHTIGDISSGGNLRDSMSIFLKKASEDILTKLENSGKVSKKKTKNKKKKGYNFFN
jgi:hypothetical protein